MPLFALDGKRPTVADDAWVAPTASIVGDVTIESGASVWYGAVLRADFGPIIVKAGANVQDGSVIHGPGTPTVIGEGATVGHLCVVHGATVGREALIGNGSTVQDGAQIGERAMVAAGTLVPPNAVVAPGTLFRGVAGKDAGPLSESAKFWVDNNPVAYQQLARRHAAGIEEVD
jgi:carbonic anhydrase/acetyltransferase-like protein (isoleucine patch superfamily)